MTSKIASGMIVLFSALTTYGVWDRSHIIGVNVTVACTTSMACAGCIGQVDLETGEANEYHQCADVISTTCDMSIGPGTCNPTTCGATEDCPATVAVSVAINKKCLADVTEPDSTTIYYYPGPLFPGSTMSPVPGHANWFWGGGELLDDVLYSDTFQRGIPCAAGWAGAPTYYDSVGGSVIATIDWGGAMHALRTGRELGQHKRIGGGGLL